MKAVTAVRMSGLVIRWVARILGIVLFVFWGAFFVEHLSWFSNPSGLPPLKVWLGMFLHFSMLAAYLAALRWTRAGGTAIIVSATAFFMSFGEYETLFFIYTAVSALPGVLYWVGWLLADRGGAGGAQFPRTVRMAVMTAGVLACALVFAGVAYMVVYPPRPYSAGSTPEVIIGSWEGDATLVWHGLDLPFDDGSRVRRVHVDIGADGSVAGHIDGAADAPAILFDGCRACKNRNALMRALRIAADHRIIGGLAGTVAPGDTLGVKAMSMPFNLDDDGVMSGTIFTHDRPGGEMKPAYVRVRLTREGG